MTTSNVELEMPGLIMQLKCKEILETIALSKMLQSVDRMVIAPGKIPVIESYHESMMSENMS